VNPALGYDVVVLGCGVAGLTAAARLAEGGARVCVLAKGVGCTHLAPGTIDVLGHDPGLVEEPKSALGPFVTAHPDHPYAAVGWETVEPALEWFRARVADGPQPGYHYVGSLERNQLLPTAIGAIRPSALVPETMADGDARSQTPVCVVGIRAMRDFHASLCAGNLRRAGIACRGLDLNLDVGRVEINALTLARRLDDPRLRAALIAELAIQLRPNERLALPAVLGLRDPHRIWSEVRERLGRPVFEIPTLPPSVPGIRVYNALVAALRAAKGRLILGAEVVGVERAGGRVSAVRAHTSGRDTTFGARWLVLATGGFASGAIELGSDWQTRERVLGLALRGVPEPGEARFSANFLAEHPLSRAGVAVDGSLQAEGTENVFVAGAALAGAIPWQEGSGEGIALSTGSAVARAILEREAGSTAAAA
jgi:glycerol-3-phosphate dehydrogenase subunit B